MFSPKKSTAMKWVTIISLVILLSFTESRILNKRDHHEHHHEDPHAHRKLIGEVIKVAGKKTFQGLALITLTQYLQKCPYDEQLQRVNAITEIAEKCSTGIRTAECGKTVTTVILDEMCKTPEDAVKYPAHAECCAKADPERNTCFLSHKLTGPDDLPPYKQPTSEQVCKQYHDNRDTMLGHYLAEVSSRHPLMYSPVLLSTTENFEIIVRDCCTEEATRDQCFMEKMPAHVKELKLTYAIQKHNCKILTEFGENTLKDMKVVQVSQRYPKVPFEDVHDIVTDITHMHKDCCSGDMMECMVERLDLTTKLCNKQDTFSSKLKECCDKPLTERSECIVKMDNDEKPADLSPQVREYIEDHEVCKHYADNPEQHLEKFTYEYSRRHQDFSTELLLRIRGGYKDLLTKCCHEENSDECLAKGEDAMKKEVVASKELMKENCDGFEKLGPYQFQNALLVKYTQKLPTVTDKSLLEITKGMSHVGARCCKLPEDKKMPCSEGGLSIIIGEMCDRQKTIFVNDKVAHCCSDSYALRRPCFTALGVDDSYVPPPFSPDMFKFSSDLCTTNQADLEQQKQTFLIRLIKQKPHIEDEQLKTTIAAFLSMAEKCCKEDNHDECFNVEGPILLEKCQAIFGVELPAAV